MTNNETIAMILTSPDWDDAAKWIVKWQFRMLGHFQTALAEAITRADEDNLNRLALGFPNQVDGYRQWAHLSGEKCLATRLRKAGLDI